MLELTIFAALITFFFKHSLIVLDDVKMSLKNPKSVIAFSLVLASLGGLTFYTILQFWSIPAFLNTPDSLNMIFILLFSTFIVLTFAALYYMPRNR